MSQNILITPTSGEPQILFRGSGNNTPIELNVLSSYQSASRSGTGLVFEGTEGQLFAITDNLSSGVIFAVGDITGLPLIKVDASGDVTLAEYGRFVGVGTGVPRFPLDVRGTGNFSSAIVTNNATINGTLGVSNNSPGAKAHFNTLVSTNKGLIIQGAAAQSANLQEWQNSAGTIMALVDRDGDIVAPTGTFGFVQLSSTLPRQSGLLFLDNNGIVHTTQNINYNYSNQASPKLSFRASGSATPDISLNILTTASGSTSGVQTLSFEGSAGQLFSITDVLNSGVIFSVNDISGLPLVEVNATGRVSLGRFGTAIDAHRTVVASEGVISNTFIRNSGNIVSATGNYTLSNIDNGEVLVLNSSSNRLITVASGLPAGFRLDIIQAGTGPVSVSGAAGVTVNSRSNFTASSGQNSMLRLISTNSNIYYLGGDLA